jgi:hypothetical protein
MIPLFTALTAKAKKVPGGPIVQALVVIAFLLIAYYVLRAVVKAVAKGVNQLINPPADPGELVDETPTADGTNMTEAEENAYWNTAQTIAESQYNAMAGWGTDEESLFTGLVNLNGVQLQQVFEAYDKKDGKNLFDWYASELSDNILASGVWWCDGDWCPPGNTPGCDSWLSDCRDRSFMRSIWQKSGLPITF